MNLAPIAGRSFPITEDFLDDLTAHDEAGAAAGLGRPLLVIHAVADEVVQVDEGERIFAAASQPKAFVALEGADHLLADRSAASAVAELIIWWLRRTLR